MAVAVGGSQVILAWTEGDAGAIGFRVERATGDGHRRRFVEIGGVGQHVTAFSDWGVRPRTTYRYRVHAWNAAGNSASSLVVEVTTPGGEQESSADEYPILPEDGG